MLRVIREPDVIGVAVGQANAKILTRANVHKVLLRCLTAAGAELTRAQMIADVGDIVVKLDGEAIWNGCDVTFLLDRQKYLGDIAMGGNVDGIIPLDFTRQLLATASERKVTALGLNNVGSFTIDINVIGVAQLSKIEVYSVIDGDPIRNLGQHVRIDRLSRNFAATGVQELTDLPFQDSRAIAYLAEHIKYSAGAVSKVRVRRNGVDVYDQLPLNVNAVMLNNAQRTRQAGYFHIEFDAERDLYCALPMPAQSLYHEITWITAAPNAYSVYIERLFQDPKAAK
jgi:hypothetical protein